MISFDIPIYGGRVIVARTADQLVRLSKLHGAEYDGEPCRGCCAPVEDERGRAIYLLGLFDRKRSTVVHEAIHLALFVLDRAGIDARESDGEAMAYLTDWLVTRLGIDRTR